MYELKLPRNAVYKHQLEKRLNVIAVIRSFNGDILYFFDTPSKVADKIKRLCRNTKYTCVAVPTQKWV